MIITIYLTHILRQITSLDVFPVTKVVTNSTNIKEPYSDENNAVLY